MPKKDGSDYIISETGNWNVADKFSKHKILKPLVMCDYYEDIAYFGYESLIDELANHEAPPNDVIRIKAFKRLIMELIRIIDNSKFALKRGNTKKTALSYKSQLKKIQLQIPNLVKTSYNNSEETTIIKIKNPLVFEQFVDIVSQIKSKINEPLNSNHLIFTDKEEFDPVAFKDHLKRRMVNKG